MAVLNAGQQKLQTSFLGITFSIQVIPKEISMWTTMMSKGQVTIPKLILDALHLMPGSKVEFSVNANGEVILHAARPTEEAGSRDRFDRVRGTADIKWRTDELMALLRGDD